MGRWYIDKGPESDVVVSSRVRLARNFKEYPFPYRMTKEQAESVLSRVKDVIQGSSSSATKNFVYMNMQELPPVDRQILMEKHLISPNLLESRVSSAAIISKDEKISVMVNEEDHLRIQCLFPGLQLDKAWNLCGKLDTLLEEKVDFAFSKQYGYLTCCSTNIGTGIRASAMLHLPALTMIGYIGRVLEACGKLGVAVRGLYGENSEATGNMFQISNQVTLGMTEAEIISNMTNITSQIMEQERTLRGELYVQNPQRLEDKVFRSLGILTHARIISTEESLKLLSDIRLGVEMGIIKDIPIEKINEVMLLIQPAYLQKRVGKNLSPDERDIQRAETVRKQLRIENGK